MFWRPKPKFSLPLLVLCTDHRTHQEHVVFVTGRRWIRPNRDPQKQWVYDGTVLAVKDGRIAPQGHISTVPESEMQAVK